VAAVGEQASSVDVVSVAEFLNVGHTTYPYTMYSNVEELEMGGLHCVKLEENNSARIRNSCYWSPPQELAEGYNAADLSEELTQLIISAVSDRCRNGKIAVSLSGGLD